MKIILTAVLSLVLGLVLGSMRQAAKDRQTVPSELHLREDGDAFFEAAAEKTAAMSTMPSSVRGAIRELVVEAYVQGARGDRTTQRLE